MVEITSNPLGTSNGSRAYHIFEKMVDAHNVRDEVGCTLQWLLRFIGLGSGLVIGYTQLEEYVNHFLE